MKYIKLREAFKSEAVDYYVNPDQITHFWVVPAPHNYISLKMAEGESLAIDLQETDKLIAVTSV